MGFASLKKTAKVKSTPAVMPFSTEVRESTKLITIDTWLMKQIKPRKERLEQHPDWSKDKLEGYEQGIIDLALDVKNEIKRLK